VPDIPKIHCSKVKKQSDRMPRKIAKQNNKYKEGKS